MAKSKKKKKPAAKRKKRVTAKRKKVAKPKAKKPAKARLKKKPKKAKAVPARPAVPSNYAKVGIVTHYFPHVQAGVILMEKGSLSVGDEIHIKGHTTDLKQKVASLQINHVPVESVKAGDEAGIQTTDRVRQHDVVYLVK